MLSYKGFDILVADMSQKMGDEVPPETEVRKYFDMADRN